MSYCTVAEVKTYAGVTGSGDDTLIDALITRAQKAIETYTHRLFEASADSTRKFTVGKDTTGRALFFDEDNCALTTVTTDADRVGGGDAIPAAQYATMPRNRTPYYGLEILSSSAYDWEYTSNPENGITVAGRWAWSTTPPADIAHACIRLAAFFYRQKDAQVFDVTAIPDAGVITIPQGLPADVKLILEPYVKRV